MESSQLNLRNRRRLMTILSIVLLLLDVVNKVNLLMMNGKIYLWSKPL